MQNVSGFNTHQTSFMMTKCTKIINMYYNGCEIHNMSVRSIRNGQMSLCIDVCVRYPKLTLKLLSILGIDHRRRKTIPLWNSSVAKI